MGLQSRDKPLFNNANYYNKSIIQWRQKDLLYYFQGVSLFASVPYSTVKEAS